MYVRELCNPTSTGPQELSHIFENIALMCPTTYVPDSVGIRGIIISSTVILAADWSIAVGYWIVFHCFSLNVNARIRISVLSSLSVFYPTSPWQLWV